MNSISNLFASLTNNVKTETAGTVAYVAPSTETAGSVAYSGSFNSGSSSSGSSFCAMA